MTKIEQIAISKLADILSSSNLLPLNPSIWERIFSNAGLEDNYMAYKDCLMPKRDFEYENDEIYYHNSASYSALKEIITLLFDNNNEYIKLFNSIVNKFNLYTVFEENIEYKLAHSEYRINNRSFQDYIETIKVDEKNSILDKFASKSFNLFLSNLDLLDLDIRFNESTELVVKPFTGSRVSGLNNECNGVIDDWLKRKYNYIYKQYNSAINAYSNNEFSNCLSACRSVIAGICSYSKESQTKWLKGLQNYCSDDKNIENMQPNNIPACKYNANSSNQNERYKYPRFNLIYELYSYTSSLGAHITEGDAIQSKEGETQVNHEIVKAEDAFLGLKMTEDFLLWIYKGNKL